MKNSLLLFFFGFCLSNFLLAQDSVWYRYDLTYYKIQTAANGNYRIYPASMKAAGMQLLGEAVADVHFPKTAAVSMPPHIAFNQ